MPWKMTIIITIVAMSIVTIAVVAAHLSLWFLWEALPDGYVRLAVKREHVAADAISSSIIPHIAPELSSYINDTRAFAVSNTQGEITFIAIPKNPLNVATQRKIARELNRGGWHVGRIGLAVVASDTTPDQPSAAKLIWNVSRRIITPGTQAPLALLEANKAGIPWYQERLAARIMAQRNEITIITAPDIQTALSLTPGAAAWPQQNEGIVLTLPGRFLGSLPGNLLPEWNRAMMKQLGFKNTEPHLLNNAAEHTLVTIESGEAWTAIAVNGNPTSFINRATEAIAAEESFHRLERRAFRLPDDTIGFELIPGTIQPPPDPENGSCQETIGLWLCREQNQAALATSQKAAENAAHQTTWRVRLSSQYVDGLPKLQSGSETYRVESIAATGDDKNAIIRLKIKTQ